MVCLRDAATLRTGKIYSVNCLLVYSLSVQIVAVAAALEACAAFVVTADDFGAMGLWKTSAAVLPLMPERPQNGPQPLKLY